jgi:RimK-like ATP-grasp domain
VIAHPTASRVAAAESWQAIVGSLMATVKNVFNEPAKSAAAALKLFQLEMAAFMGLRFPRTLVTNDPEQARSFVENQSAGAICKMLSGATAGPGFETHRLEKLDDLWRIKNCPIFLQEYVAAEHDVRVTVIGERVFSARIEFENDQNCIDTRFTSKSISETRLPLDRGVDYKPRTNSWACVQCSRSKI